MVVELDMLLQLLLTACFFEVQRPREKGDD
uniref:Uncharacterized protein n=1 Tax=Rhizophora mucronata TaxID=61149 RepID=A0A2P2QYX0_RHIMU